MAFDQTTSFESKSATETTDGNKLAAEAVNLFFEKQHQKASADKVAIGTCPDCNPPFEWPPNEPKPAEPKPTPKPTDTKTKLG